MKNPYYNIDLDAKSVQFFHFYNEKPTFQLTFKELLSQFAQGRPKPKKAGNGVSSKADIMSCHIDEVALFAKMKSEAERVLKVIFPVNLRDDASLGIDAGLFSRVAITAS